MKLIYDISFIGPDDINRGIPVHSLIILDNMPASMRSDVKLLVHPLLRDYFAERLPGYELHTFKVPPIARAVKPLKPWLYKQAVRSIADGAEWIIIPDEFRPFTTARLPLKKAIFVHDIKMVKMPQPKDWHIAFYRDAINSADLVMAISDFTRQDIANYYRDIDMTKIHVVHNAIELAPAALDEATKARLPKDYILWVNTLVEYKNVMTTLRAFVEIAPKVPHSLVVVGRPTDYWENVCVPYLKSNNLSDRVTLLSGVPKEALTYLYTHASLFVTSSTHEGFGFTPIEAAMCGCPVVSSMEEALPETTKMLLNYYEPATDHHAMANKILELLASPPTPEKLKSIADTFAAAYAPATQLKRLLSLLK